MNLTVDVLSMEVYRRFLAQQDIMPATVYHNPLWLSAVQVGLGLQVTILGLFDGAELIGVLPGFVARKYSLGLFGAPLRGSMTPYLGWLFKNHARPPSQATLDQVDAFATHELHCQYTEIGFLAPPPGLGEGTVPDRWHIAPRETYMIDLRIGEAALWKRLEPRGRSKVKKATKSGVRIEAVTDRRIMDEFYPMLEASYGRHNAVPSHPKELFLALHDRLVPAGLMEVLAAIYEGRVIAIALLVHDEREVRCMSSASYAEYHHLQPNNLVQWHAIQWAAARGLARYDLGGKGQPTIDSFKQTFGPTVHAFTFYWRATAIAALARSMVLRAWPEVQRWRYRLQQIWDGGHRHTADIAASLAGGTEP